MVNRKSTILKAIKRVVREDLPSFGVKVILFGSQARGDAREDSDWDLMILVDKDKLEESDYDKYSYPLFELGWKIDAEIHPLLYTLKDWHSKNCSMFYHNVEREGILL